MKSLIKLLCVFLLIMFFGCGDSNNKNEQSKVDEKLKETTGMTSGEIQQETDKYTVAKKYPIKSGIITFKRTGVLGDQKVIVYFDDYGIKERSETYKTDGSVEEIKFTDGEFMYKITHEYSEEKVAFIMGPGKFGTEMKFDPDPFRNNDERKKKYQFEKLPNMNILGKDCDAYITTTKMGTTTFAGSNGILLYTKADLSVGTMETIAVDFKENVSIDSELFKVPDGYTAKQI